ncbi:hypothetical protein D5086_005364 [Populus alba]|uniref:Uncharacterized protein n=1 Tax=Populus alba TaxID=43335 RepID=A0ACC4CU68_POPAL
MLKIWIHLKLEYVYRYDGGDCNCTVQIGQKEMIQIGNLGAYQFWQRIFKDRHRLERLKHLLKIDEMTATTVEKLGRDGFFFLGESFPFNEEGFGQMSNTVTLLESQRWHQSPSRVYLHCNRLLTFSLASMLPDFKNICTMSMRTMRGGFQGLHS